MKGALFASVIVFLVCSIPCIMIVVYYRSKRMQNEVAQAGLKSNVGPDHLEFTNMRKIKERKEKK